MLSTLTNQTAVEVGKAAARTFFASAAAAGRFDHVQPAAKDPILGVTENFLACTDPNKMNLGVGAYRTDEGKPIVLPAVREAEKRVAGNFNMEYLPIGGLKSFTDRSVALAFGDGAPVIKDGLVAAVQSLSGTGSCRLMAEFQKRYMPGSKVLFPNPTWSNHHNIWADTGVEQDKYRYYKAETRGLDFEGMMEDLKAAPDGSLILLHACAHNPTGVDPTMDQWGEIATLVSEKNHFPFFDMAYQGFASGDCDKDAASIRMFLERGIRIGCSQSFAKNMGLYGQRAGALSIVCDTPEETKAVESQMKMVARPMYSNPPLHGALLVDTVLGDAALNKQWLGEVKEMADRINLMRSTLRTNLEATGSSLAWNHVTDQIGMFCFSGMTGEQVDKLAAEHSIFMTRNGRISMAGVTSQNVGRLAEAIHAVTK